ncbi:hypothetical protein XB02_19145 [Pantoea ananatis]|nr:hypothetical protein XB02_19145 [Pantoea ananatis]
MSDGKRFYSEEQCIAAIRSMKGDVDVIFRQLMTGAYASPDTFANNWAHLIEMVKEMKPFLSQPGVTDRIMQTDAMLMTDLLAITYAVAIVENFLACLERQARGGNSQGSNPA